MPRIPDDPFSNTPPSAPVDADKSSGVKFNPRNFVWVLLRGVGAGLEKIKDFAEDKICAISGFVVCELISMLTLRGRLAPLLTTAGLKL